MGKNDRLSRDQKRKAKLKKRAARSRKHESLAYAGAKYKTNLYAPILFRTEIGIYESYVMLDRELTDDEVEGAIETLVLRMREGPLPLLSDSHEVTITADGEEELIIENIRRNWRILAEEGSSPPRDDLIGVLRTILHSISVWRSKSLLSQGYLNYIEGFLKKLGVSVEVRDQDFNPLPEPEEDPILVTGRSWITDGNTAAKATFAEQVEGLLRDGDGGRVIDVCQELMGETKDMSVIPLLSEYTFRGHQSVSIQMG